MFLPLVKSVEKQLIVLFFIELTDRNFTVHHPTLIAKGSLP